MPLRHAQGRGLATTGGTLRLRSGQAAGATVVFSNLFVVLNRTVQSKASAPEGGFFLGSD